MKHIDLMVLFNIPYLSGKGEDRYQINILSNGTKRSNTVSFADIYAFHLSIRPNKFNHIHMARKLFQQYKTDN